jgi:methylaspartate mutase epsilon subunit
MRQVGCVRRILLCGIGGDAHSVGLHLLRFALTRQGHDILFLGTQNTLDDIFAFAADADAALLSCMDGHAVHYLKAFPEYLQRFPHAIPWYLGGTPTLGNMIGAESLFIGMGFRRVFLGFVEVAAVIDLLEQDLAHVEASSRTLSAADHQTGVTVPMAIPADVKLPADMLLEQRGHVLQQWHTGRASADFADNATFLKAQRPLAACQTGVKRQYENPLLQPRSGVATVEGQLALFMGMQKFGADVLSYQIDSLSRNNNYAGAADAIRDSSRTVSALNGFPAVNHGVQVLRRMARSVRTPLQCRHSTRDPRLLAEICYAGGVTAFEGGAICYNIPYYKSYNLADSISTWQYVDRLTGYYFDEFGVILDREFFGVLTAALIPPCLAITTGLLEAILAAQQGVRSISIGYAEQGNRAQDIAAIRTIERLGRKFLDAFGYNSVTVSSVFHQYMAAFPLDRDRACQLIRASSTTAALSGATRMLTKTAAEAYRTPSLADNIEGLALSRQGYVDANSEGVGWQAVEGEKLLIEREVEELMSGVIALGRGNVAAGVVAAFQHGALDIPFAPSLHNAGLVNTGRDLSGAIRFIECGKLPLSRETKSFHAEKIAERRRSMSIGEKHDYMMIEKDLLQIARGEYLTWPLS